MSDSLIIYYSQHVVAAYVEYRTVSADKFYGNHRDLKKAIEATSALFHFREHLPPHMALSRATAEARCPDYGLLGDAANSAKHKSISNMTPHGAPLVNNADNISEEKIIISYKDDQGEYSVSLKVVFLKLTNGGERYLLEVLTNVLNFWEDYLHSHGILPSKRVFQCKDPFRRRTRAECKDTSDGIQLTQGLPAQLRLRFMRFDEAVGRAIPVDLTGSKIEFRVFKPKPVELVISAIRNADGKVFEKSVQLQPEEAHEVENCADDEAKSRFLSTLPAVKKALGDLNAELKAQEGQANSAVQ